MRQVSDTHGRTFPRQRAIPLGEDRDSDDRTVERIADHARRDLRELDQSTFGDKRDRAVVRSRGVNKEIKVTHGMPVKPTHYSVILQTGPGSLWQSRSGLADNRVAYFKTDAASNVAFEVYFDVLEPIHGKGQTVLIIAEDIPDVVGDPEIKPGGKGKPGVGKGKGAT